MKSHANIQNLFPDKIFDIQTSFDIPIATVKEVWPSISVRQSQSLPVYQDFENWKNTKGSPFETKINFVSDFTQILCVRPFDLKDFKFWVFFKKKFFQNFSIFS